MASYELMVLLGSNQEESEREGLLKKIEEIVNSSKGKIKSLKLFGKKELAYTIKKEKVAYFHLLELEGPADLIQTLDKKIRLQDGILRHLMVRKEEAKEK
jgi:small subunit ribosomal protein S6